eukprot:s3817_g6.t1
MCAGDTWQTLTLSDSLLSGWEAEVALRDLSSSSQLDVAEPDSELDVEEEDPEEDAAQPRNNFQSWMETVGFTDNPQLIPMLNMAGELKRYVHWTSDDELAPVVHRYLSQENIPLQLGPVTVTGGGDDRKVYLNFLVADYSFGNRVQADLLCFVMLHLLAGTLRQPDITLRVCWSTHKYKLGATGQASQSRKGSGGRTHYYLLATRHGMEQTLPR